MIIAEIGSVHDGSFGNALKLIRMAADCGADVVKFQTHIAQEETLKNAPNPIYFKGEDRFSYFSRTAFTLEQLRELVTYASECNVKFLSSPFSLAAVDILREVGCGMYKIPSGEVTNIPLIEKIAEEGKPAILSSGMSNWNELDEAVSILLGKVDLTIMQCTSKYPCPIESVGLNVISEIVSRYGEKVTPGLSDHSMSIFTGTAGVMAGAKVFEKHLTFSRCMYGSDAANAMEPKEFSLYCKGIIEARLLLENPVKKDEIADYSDMREVFQKSLVFKRSMNAGEKLALEDIAFKKPGTGISANQYRKYLGCELIKDVEEETLICESDFVDK